MARDLGTIYAPSRMILAIPSDAKNLPAPLAAKRADAATAAYLCVGMTCSAPVTDFAELRRKLAARVTNDLH